MALRDYMRELLRTKTFTESDLRQEENDVVQITIVDDNSSSALSLDDCCHNATNNQNDVDGDGCEDATEDTDDDNDGFADDVDACKDIFKGF